MIHVSLLGAPGMSNGAHQLLRIPAQRDSIDTHSMKMDFSALNSSSGPSGGRNPGARLIPGPLGSGAAAQPAGGAGNASSMPQQLPRSSSNARGSASAASLYPDVPISEYLSRFKVTVAPVEVAATHPPLMVAGGFFFRRMLMAMQRSGGARAQGDACTGQVQVDKASSLHALVMESYKRNQVPLPSSMAAFTPKIKLSCPMVGTISTQQLLGICLERVDDRLAPNLASYLEVHGHTCNPNGMVSLSGVAMSVTGISHTTALLTFPATLFPQITIRGVLIPGFAPDLAGLSMRHSDILAVVVLSDLHLSTRYITTCYMTLVRSATVHAHMEAYFTWLPRAAPLPPPGQAGAGAPGGPADPTAGDSAPANLVKPQRGPFAKVWLHPDDVGLAFSQEAGEVGLVPGMFGAAGHGFPGRHMSTRGTMGGASMAGSLGLGLGLGVGLSARARRRSRRASQESLIARTASVGRWVTTSASMHAALPAIAAA